MRKKSRKLAGYSLMAGTHIKFYIVFAFAVIFILPGCLHEADKKKESLKDELTTPGEYIEYGNPQYQFKLKYPVDLLSEYNNPESKAVFSFPESYTTGTNLGVAQIRLDINRRNCDDFNAGEDAMISWHYSGSLALDSAFSEKISVNGVEFKRLKCSDAAMSHVADSLTYFTEKDGNAISLTLYLISANPEVYDEALRPRTYDPAEMEKIFLQVLASFKYMNNYDGT